MTWGFQLNRILKLKKIKLKRITLLYFHQKHIKQIHFLKVYDIIIMFQQFKFYSNFFLTMTYHFSSQTGEYCFTRYIIMIQESSTNYTRKAIHSSRGF